MFSLLVWRVEWNQQSHYFMQKANGINFPACTAKNVRVEKQTKSIVKCDLNNWIVAEKTIKSSWCFEGQFYSEQSFQALFSQLKFHQINNFSEMPNSKAFSIIFMLGLGTQSQSQTSRKFFIANKTWKLEKDRYDKAMKIKRFWKTKVWHISKRTVIVLNDCHEWLSFLQKRVSKGQKTTFKLKTLKPHFINHVCHVRNLKHVKG